MAAARNAADRLRETENDACINNLIVTLAIPGTARQGRPSGEGSKAGGQNFDP
jgi:hypothetical protein